MTEQEFKNRKFGHSQAVDYLCPRRNERLSALIMAVNFDGGTFLLWLVPQTVNGFDIPEQEISVSYEHVFPPKFKLKKV